MGDVPGLESVATAIGRRCLRMSSIGGALSFLQHIIRAGQQHRDDARARHRGEAVLVRIFEMIGRQRAELGGKRRAARIRQLIGVQLDRKPARLAAANTRAISSRVKAIRSQNPSTASIRPSLRQRRDHRVGDIGDIGVAFVGEFGRQRVCAEKRRADRDIALFGELARDAERFALGGKVEPIAGFDFHRADALGDKSVQSLERRSQEFVLARGAGRADGGKNAAAFASDLLHRWRPRA